MLLLARLVCSEDACAGELVEVEAATLAELESFACACGCALHVVAWPDVLEAQPPAPAPASSAAKAWARA